ncbi:CobW family GTP-binding protein [Paraburkholderia ginsengiterrae]|uniref:Cobalamin biosynthesis protein CobW n=1 Tax=Paraburkholderia ginsengiterrae TaxID=1462993 RepID=A0A1A9N795_9BURK|nr:CobW family GTP-binding protein [Paraburkholderia ginsengiterrae]OAJ60191.1 cobalamin biosynthesis protein CobW [Paraburkholderia ginsengiterrae]
MNDAAPPIALVVLGGYLGAGKTTLLNHVLLNAGQRRVAVLVNDFGDINIDASLIRERTDDVINLENGCICCSVGGRLVDALVKIGARPERPELLIIEASGVSDPVKIAQIGLLDRAFRLCGIIVAVDAERIGQTLQDPYVGDIVRRQIAGATALVLNKTDLVSENEKTAAKEAVAAQASTAILLESNNGAIPLELIFDASVVPRQRTGGAGLTNAAGQLSNHSGITSFSYRSDFRLDKKKLKDAFRNMSVALLRAKGIVWLDQTASPQELHVVGGRILITPFTGHASAESTIVLIGRFTDEDERAVKRCLDNARAVNQH